MLKGCGCKIVFLVVCFSQLTAAAFAQEDAQLAVSWAPTIDQLFNTAGNSSQANPAQEDTCTVFNFDLDWRANNNWENLNYYKLKPPSVYYSAVETGKYVYLGYYFYYPRHVGDKPHGNDFAGLALAVEKPEFDETGRLAGILLYDDGGWQEISLSKLPAAGSPLRITISAGKHNLAPGEEDSLDNNILTYNPQNNTRNVTAEGEYRLVPLDELWRHHIEIQTGEALGTLDGKSNGDLKDLPWRWQYKGVRWLSDPAAVFRLITGNKTFTGDYLSNPYAE